MTKNLELKRVLIIEDREGIRRQIRRALSKNDEEFVVQEQFARFETIEASTDAEARETLDRAIVECGFFYVVILDLGLPNVEIGYKLLEDLNGKYKTCCGHVVVYSTYDQTKHCINVIKRGAADFVPKTNHNHKELLYQSVVNSARKVEHDLINKWDQLTTTNNEWVVRQSQREFLDGLFSTATKGIQRCLLVSEEMKEAIQSQFHIQFKSDSTNQIARTFERIRTELIKTGESLAQHRPETPTKRCNLSLWELLVEKLAKFRPGIVSKKIEIEAEKITDVPLEEFHVEFLDVVEQIVFLVISRAQKNSEISIVSEMDSDQKKHRLRINTSAEFLFDVADHEHEKFINWMAKSFGGAVNFCMSNPASKTIEFEFPALNHAT